MGTYTTNYQLYKPTVGERGWGTLINGNYDTIDTTMKGLSNRITAVESEVNGALSCTSVATSGTITSTGLITANGGVNGGAITGTTITATTKFSGILYGKVYVNAKTSTTKYNNDVQYATKAAQTLTLTCNRYGDEVTSSTMTVAKYSKISLSYPYQLYPGIYIPSSSYFTDSVPNLTSFTLTVSQKTGAVSSNNYPYTKIYVNDSQVGTISGEAANTTKTKSFTVNHGDKVYMTTKKGDPTCSNTATIAAQPTYYINVV